MCAHSHVVRISDFRSYPFEKVPLLLFLRKANMPVSVIKTVGKTICLNHRRGLMKLKWGDHIVILINNKNDCRLLKRIVINNLSRVLMLITSLYRISNKL
jgi:hypothetical protein